MTKMRWAGYETLKRDRKPEEKRPLGKPSHTWEAYEWILQKQDWKVWNGSPWLRTGIS